MSRFAFPREQSIQILTPLLTSKKLFHRARTGKNVIKPYVSSITTFTNLWGVFNIDDESVTNEDWDRTDTDNNSNQFAASLLHSVMRRATQTLKSKNDEYAYSQTDEKEVDNKNDTIKDADVLEIVKESVSRANRTLSTSSFPRNSIGKEVKDKLCNNMDNNTFFMELEDDSPQLLRSAMRRATNILQSKDVSYSLNNNTSESEKKYQTEVFALLEDSTSRAGNVLSSFSSSTSKSELSENPKNTQTSAVDDELSINYLLESCTLRSTQILKFTNSSLTNTTTPSSMPPSQSFHTATPPNEPHKDKRKYLDEPSVTATALAHSLWSNILIPYRDTAIDATCGNGKDSLVLANLLFPSPSSISNASKTSSLDSTKPELICIDIQSRAISNTSEVLQSNLPSNIYSSNIRVLQMSHDDNLRSIPNDVRSVGLVCYNLGWLPGGLDGSESKSICTEMKSTLHSIADAVLILREGGLLSIMTYPGSGKMEAMAVSLFCQCLAIFTSKQQKKKGGWERFIDNYEWDGYLMKPENVNDQEQIDSDVRVEYIKDVVKENIKKVWLEGYQNQTWRVFEHKPLGRPLSPVLITATRIK